MEVVRRRDLTIVRVPNRNAQALVMYCVVWPVAWMYLPIWIHLAGVVVLFALLSAKHQFRVDASPTITWEQTVVGFVYRRGQVARDAHICGFVCEFAGVPVVEFSERRGFIDFWTGKKDAELAAEELRIAVARHRQPRAYR